MNCPACHTWVANGGHPTVQRAASGFLTLDQVACIEQVVGQPVDSLCPACLVRGMAEAV